jgi:GDP-L-fucose synthase
MDSLMSKSKLENNYWYGKQVLVTGGNGFIGSFVAEQLLGHGAHVRVSASTQATSVRFLEHVKDQIDFVIGDLQIPKIARKCVEGVDVLLHLAARVGGIEYNIQHPGSIFRDNMQVFMNILEAARLEGVSRTSITSSACVYPRHCSIPTPEIEGFNDRPEPTNEGYGWAKRMEEFMAEAYAKEFGMNICIARPYNAYGPRDNFDPASSHVIPALIHKIEQGHDPLIVFGDGSASRSFLYVEDFARGIVEITEKSPQVQAINIGTQEETTIMDLVHLILKISGRKLEIKFDHSKPNGQPRRCCDTTLAQKLIGFKATVSLEEGIARTLDWYRTHNMGNKYQQN